jgi:hypothetical protein
VRKPAEFQALFRGIFLAIGFGGRYSAGPDSVAGPRSAGLSGRPEAMSIDIKLSVTITLEETALEDALAEYDEMQVGKLIQQVLDKAIALDQIDVKVVEGPNSLEDYDQARTAS